MKNFKDIFKFPPGTPEYKICHILGNHVGEQTAITLDYLTRLAYHGLCDNGSRRKCLIVITRLKRDYHVPICGSRKTGFWLKEEKLDKTAQAG